MSEIHALFIIAFIAVLAPLLARLPALIRTPVVVLELVLGILIGPSGAGWVASQGAIGFLGEFGLIFLFFQAGFEFSPAKIGAGAHRLGALAWLVSLGLTGIFIGLLYIVGLVRAPLLVGLMLPLPLALLAATTLPLVVAMTYLGVRTGDMLPENASALVGAAVITVAVFPPLAILLRSKSKEARPDGVVAIAARRVADFASAQFSRFIVFISQKTWGKR
jgi:Kef-type K+ transport system membrane component KefB